MRCGPSSEPLLCLSRKRSSHVPLSALVTALLPQEERPHPVTVLRFKPFILSLDCLLFLTFAKLFCFAYVLESMEEDERELFPQRRASIVKKAVQTERWIRFLAEGEQGTCERNRSVPGKKRQNVFSN